jgi:sodium/bile acid cotransporter 7
MKMIKIDFFMTAMILVIAFAALFPQIGAKGGPIHAGLLSQFGIAAIFFLNGAQLSLKAMRDGLLSWKAHLLIQSATYILFPLLGLVIYALISAFYPAPGARILGLGVFYLCAAPSTISSSVAMTSQAKGHVTVAVFNASLSSLIGIFITPFLVSFTLKTSGQTIDFWPILIDLLCLIVAPMVAGQIMRPLIGAWLKSRKNFVHFTDRAVILFIIYASFCDSFLSQAFRHTQIWDFVIIFVIDGFLLLMGIMGLQALSLMMKFSFQDRVAVTFCGTTKSMASGVTMAGLIFAGTGLATGSILLPLMIYHPLQLSVFSILAQKWSKR